VAKSSAVDVDAANRARRTALTRRKLNRLDDLLDVLDDCVRDGAVTDEELTERELVVGEFQAEARRLRGALNSSSTISTTTNTAGTAAATAASVASSVVHDVHASAQALGAVIGKGVATAGDLVASATRGVAEAVPGMERAATMVNAAVEKGAGSIGLPVGVASRVGGSVGKNGETWETREMDTQELLARQTSAMQSQDDALDGLDALVGTLKMTSDAIHDEVVLQAKLVEDLEADFSHTSDRMRKLRKQGFKLAGEKNEEERERLDRNEVIEEMRAKLTPEAQEESSCVIQ
jgi:hypothetical protein